MRPDLNASPELVTPAPRRRRLSNVAGRILVTLLVLAPLAGCGGESSGSSGSAALRITVWPQGKTGSSISYTLKCPQGTGTLPRASAACSKLGQVSAKTFAPVPAGTACSELYGGPQTASVSGRLAGKAISAHFTRTNGCEIERWGRLAFLFPLGS
jgi:hypothetical protein